MRRTAYIMLSVVCFMLLMQLPLYAGSFKVLMGTVSGERHYEPPVPPCQEPDQLPHGTGPVMGATSDSDPDNTATDNISLGPSVSVTGVTWWGMYFQPDLYSPCKALPTDDFIITIYDDNSGYPGNPVATATPSVPRTATGPTMYGLTTEYVYEALVDAPFIAMAGEQYWLEIINRTGTSECLWLWEVAPPADSKCILDFEGNGYDDNVYHDFDLAWCLTGEVSSAHQPRWGEVKALYR